VAEHTFPVILGRDYAGVVEQVGSGVTGFAVGDQILGGVPGMSPAVHDGAWAELLAVPAQAVAHLPDGVDLAQAGAAPWAGLTALAAADALDLRQGGTLLVIGATGGVGSLAVQLAATAGATILAPASRGTDYLRGLGWPRSWTAAPTSPPSSASATLTGSTPC
jgi:NADPH:quinone reductase